MITQVQIDPAAAVTNGSATVGFSRNVALILGVEAGAQIVFPADPASIYTIESVAGNGLTCVLSTPFAGPSGATPCWFYNVTIPGMVLLGSGPLTTGATSIMLTAATDASSAGPIEILFASQPYQFSLVFAVPYKTVGGISVTPGSTTVVSFWPPYTGPTTTGSVNVGLVGFNG